MTDNRFRTVALALRDHVGDTYNLLAAADAVIAADPYPTPEPLRIPDEVLYRIARANDDVCEAMRQGKRVKAIKALRALFIPNSGMSVVGLMDAKTACEGNRWEDLYDQYRRIVPQGDPWAVNYPDDEPPF